MKNIQEILKNEEKNKFAETDKQVVEFLIDIKKNNEVLYDSIKLCNKLKDSVGQIFNKKYLY